MAAVLAGGPINTGTISNLFAPGLRKVIFPTLEAMAQKEIFSIYSNVVESKRQYEDDQPMSGFATLGHKTEGKPMNQDLIAQHGQKHYTWVASAGAFGITFEAKEDDLYEVVGPNPAKLMRLHLEAMQNARELDAASVLNNATATTGSGAGIAANAFGTVEALISSSHALARGGTQSNTPATATAISLQFEEAATIHFLAQVGEEGFYNNGEYSYCMVHPNQWANVEKLHGSELEPYTNDNQINFINARMSKTRGLVYILNPFLTNTNATFFFASKGSHYVNFFERNKLVAHSWDDPSAMVGYFGQYSRYGFGATYWRGIFGALP